MTKMITPERAAFLKAQKELHTLELYAQLSEQGINVSQIPKQRIADIWENIELQKQAQVAGQSKIQDLQQETWKALQTLQAEGNKIIEELARQYGQKQKTKYPERKEAIVTDILTLSPEQAELLAAAAAAKGTDSSEDTNQGGA